jgi:hypothetical protein
MLFIHGSFARGMVVGAAVVLVFGGLAVMVNQMTGTASLDMGALAETWTASELRPLRRNGWRIANHLLLRFGDIDHLLVGPNGVLIIETKWSAYEWAPGTDRFQQAIRQVKGRARDVRLWRPELRHASPDLVRPVLFLWGGSRSDAPKPDVAKTVDGVEVIYGITAARAWRTDLVQNYPAGEISEAELTAIWNAVRENAGRLDRREQLEPVPPSIARAFGIVMSAFLAATVALLACLYSFQAVASQWHRAAIAAAFAVIGVVARRWRPARMMAIGWLTGTGFAVAVVVAVVLIT